SCHGDAAGRCNGQFSEVSARFSPGWPPTSTVRWSHMRRWIQKIVVVLATGYILFFYSERMFWSFPRPGDNLGDLLLTWIVYSLLAWVFLSLIRQCRIAAF